MKNRIFFLLIFFLLVGCNNDKKTSKKNETRSVATSTSDTAKPEAVKTQKTEELKNENEDTAKSVSAEKVKPEPEKDATQEKKEIKVTFIELGSVNCIPCKMMQPIMREIEKEYGNQVKVVFHDVWTPEGRPYAQEYRIRAIPTQIFLDKEGNEFFRHEGFFPKDGLVKILKDKGVN